MKTIWIFCLLSIQHGCWETKIHSSVYAYKTEYECNKAIDEARKQPNSSDSIIHAQCESVDSLLKEKYGNE